MPKNAKFQPGTRVRRTGNGRGGPGTEATITGEAYHGGAYTEYPVRTDDGRTFRWGDKFMEVVAPDTPFKVGDRVRRERTPGTVGTVVQIKPSRSGRGYSYSVRVDAVDPADDFHKVGQATWWGVPFMEHAPPEPVPCRPPLAAGYLNDRLQDIIDLLRKDNYVRAYEEATRLKEEITRAGG